MCAEEVGPCSMWREHESSVELHGKLQGKVEGDESG